MCWLELWFLLGLPGLQAGGLWSDRDKSRTAPVLRRFLRCLVVQIKLFFRTPLTEKKIGLLDGNYLDGRVLTRLGNGYE